MKANLEQSFKIFEEFSINVEKVVEELSKIPISLHCWQGDDVGGFEKFDAKLSGGGIQATGNYPGKARTPDELRQDYEKAFSLIPGKHRINIHAIYGDFTKGFKDRNEITIDNYTDWIAWAKEQGLKIDFNATLFSHPNASNGYTLSHPNKSIREFWIEHVKRCRKISEQIGKALNSPCIHNLWIPDGAKDVTVGRMKYRQRLIDSLDSIYSEQISKEYMMDAVEGKLFGIGSESFVVGSHDFYYGYAMKKGLILTMDMGHYHPTESVADKISAILPFTNKILLHISRGVRWDSDHIVLQSDELNALCEEIVRSERMQDIYLALDYFDASVNRIGAWVLGMRNTLKALMIAKLQPVNLLRELEEQGNNFKKLALLEEFKNLPYGAIWDHYCELQRVPKGTDWILKIEEYEKNVLKMR